MGKDRPTDAGVPPADGVRVRLEGRGRAGQGRTHQRRPGHSADSAPSAFQKCGLVQGPVRDGKALLGRQRVDGAHRRLVDARRPLPIPATYNKTSPTSTAAPSTATRRPNGEPRNPR